MLGIRELESALGLTTDQVRARVAHLRDNFADVVLQGQRGKLLVTDRGLALLRRLQDLERQGHSLQTATRVIREELAKLDDNSPDGSPTVAEPAPMPILFQTLQDTVSLLRTQLEAKDREIERLHDLLNRQLPPVSQGRLSRWAHLKAALLGWGNI